jgi:hypothetical protein
MQIFLERLFEWVTPGENRVKVPARAGENLFPGASHE